MTLDLFKNFTNTLNLEQFNENNNPLNQQLQIHPDSLSTLSSSYQADFFLRCRGARWHVRHCNATKAQRQPQLGKKLWNNGYYLVILSGTCRVITQKLPVFYYFFKSSHLLWDCTYSLPCKVENIILLSRALCVL